MNEIRPPLSETDYEAIEAAVMETERGRWFLAEYAARNRNSDTNVLLDAIKKLERSLSNGAAGASAPSTDQIRFDLVEMASAIAQTKREIASLRSDDQQADDVVAATEELDAIVVATETATQAILEAAEHIQEVTWTMRENGVDENHCEAIDAQVTEIYTSCSFQDITGQRTSKVVAVLNYLEDRLEAMRHIWGGEDAEIPTSPARSNARPDAHLLNGPQLEGKGNEQDDVDLLISTREQLYEAVVAPAQTETETAATPAAEEHEAEATPIIAEAVVVEEESEDEQDYEIVETVSPPPLLAHGPADETSPTSLHDDDKLALFS